jgi:pimeloyl-ACP methyl ester carboxylesterase
LVVLHGLGSSAADYAWAFGDFRRSCASIILPDLYGHGASAIPAADTAVLREAQLAALADLIPERAILLGNSLGGVVATQLFSRVRGRIAAMVLVSPGGAPMSESELSSFLQGFHMEDSAAARRFVARLLGRPALWARPYAWGVRHRMTRPYIRSFVGSIRPEDLLTAAEVAAIACPVLLYWGSQDRVIPEAARSWWLEHLPHATLMTPEGYGHAPFLDDPHGFAKSVIGYLRTVLPGPSP